MLRARERVLLVRLGRLGDVVMTTPAIRWLAACDDIELTVLTDEHYAPVVRRAASVARLLSPSDAPREGRFQTWIDLHGVPASNRLLAALPSPDLRVVVHKESLARRTLVLSDPSPVPTVLQPRWTWPERHLAAVDRYWALSRWMPPPRPPSRPALALSAELPDAHLGPVGIIVGASTPTKAWAEEELVAFVRTVEWRLGRSVRLFAGPADRAAAQRIERASGAQSWLDGGVDGLCEGLGGCAVVVGGDTGPTHLAAALGRPIVMLFGPTPEAAGFDVWRPRAEVLRVPDLPCAPCDLHGPRRCPLGHLRCMSHGHQAVAEAVGRVLAAG